MGPYLEANWQLEAYHVCFITLLSAACMECPLLAFHVIHVRTDPLLGGLARGASSVVGWEEGIGALQWEPTAAVGPQLLRSEA